MNYFIDKLKEIKYHFQSCQAWSFLLYYIGFIIGTAGFLISVMLHEYSFSVWSGLVFVVTMLYSFFGMIYIKDKEDS